MKCECEYELYTLLAVVFSSVILGYDYIFISTPFYYFSIFVNQYKIFNTPFFMVFNNAHKILLVIIFFMVGLWNPQVWITFSSWIFYPKLFFIQSFVIHNVSWWIKIHLLQSINAQNFNVLFLVKKFSSQTFVHLKPVKSWV